MNKAIVTTVASATMMALAGAASAADNCQGGAVDSTGLCAFEGGEARQVSSGGDTSFGNFDDPVNALASRLQEMEQATEDAHDRADTGVRKANNAHDRADEGVSRANTGISKANYARNRADYGVSRANTGISKANSAQSTADNAHSDASNAYNRADYAVDKAEDAGRSDAEISSIAKKVRASTVTKFAYNKTNSISEKYADYPSSRTVAENYMPEWANGYEIIDVRHIAGRWSSSCTITPCSSGGKWITSVDVQYYE